MSLHVGCWRELPLHPCLLRPACSPQGLFVSAAQHRSFPSTAWPSLRARWPGQEGRLGGSSWYFVPFTDFEHLTRMMESVSLKAHITFLFHWQATRMHRH